MPSSGTQPRSSVMSGSTTSVAAAGPTSTSSATAANSNSNSNSNNSNSNNVIPPALAPSVEQNYRKKCIELKRRMAEVDETNDAYRLRKIRLNRGIMKLRLERAFLLEQLAKRTSTNVEDSEGSPSPPPTPKEKPLRIKRGHRRPDMSAHLTPPVLRAASASSNVDPNSVLSPPAPPLPAPPAPLPLTTSSRSGNPPQTKKARLAATRAAGLPRRPPNAYMIFCDTARDRVKREQGHEPDYDMHKALAQAWRDLGKAGQAPFFDIYDERREAFERELKRLVDAAAAGSAKNGGAEVQQAAAAVLEATEQERDAIVAPEPEESIMEPDAGDDDTVEEDDGGDDRAATEEPNEDVEMGDEADDGGFTAVNR